MMIKNYMKTGGLFIFIGAFVPCVQLILAVINRKCFCLALLLGALLWGLIQPVYAVRLDTEGTWVPMTPTPSYPALGETVYTRNPMLRWCASSDAREALEYKLEISRDPDFRVIEIPTVFLPGTAWTYTFNSFEAGRYYWRIMQRFYEESWTDWSDTSWFFIDASLPPPVRIIRPAPSDVVTLTAINPYPTFVWNAVPGATRYHFQLSTKSDFQASDIIHQNSDLPLNNYTLRSDLPEGEYYWRVKALRESGWGAQWNAGGPIPFFLRADLDTWHRVELVAPTDHSFVSGPRPLLIFRRFPQNILNKLGTGVYEMQVSKRRDFSELAFHKTGMPPLSYVEIAWETDEDLENYMTYYWRVRHTAESWMGARVWSFMTSFIPDIPAITSPPLGSVINNLRPTITWNPVPYAYFYDLRLFRGSLGGTCVFSANHGGTSITLDRDLSINERYVWEIRACNEHVRCSGWCAGWFEVALGIERQRTGIIPSTEQLAQPTTQPPQPPTARPLMKAGSQPLPDLIIDDIFLDKSCRVVIRVKNLGPGPVPDDVWTARGPESAGVYLQVNGRPWGGASIWQFDPRRSLQPKNGTASYTSKRQITGTAMITATVDRTRKVKELNERNNGTKKQLTCALSIEKKPVVIPKQPIKPKQKTPLAPKKPIVSK